MFLQNTIRTGWNSTLKHYWLHENFSKSDGTDEIGHIEQLHTEVVNEFLEGLFNHKTPFTIVLIVLYSVIFLVGLVGNSLVIIVMIKHRHMRTITNMFLVNLSVGDLLVVIVCMPFSLAPYIYKVSC